MAQKPTQERQAKASVTIETLAYELREIRLELINQKKAQCRFNRISGAILVCFSIPFFLLLSVEIALVLLAAGVALFSRSF